MNPELSVIIPTYNRKEILKKVLLSIKKNDFTKPFEVVIIDDGSTDNTYQEIQDFLNQENLVNFSIFRQENGGPSKARNAGIKKAQAEILLIIGDDSITDPNLLSEHYKWNTEKYPEKNIAILGHNEWDPEIEITPFMEWIDATGMQFSYFRFKDENSPTWGDLWTCNISLKKSFLMDKGLFDEEFPYAAWEDVELGYRLSKHGFQIKYNKDAKVFHHHPTSFASVKKRMVAHGYSQLILAKKLGDDYSNPLFKEPVKTLLWLYDKVLTYTGLLFLFDKLCQYLETKKIISSIFYSVLYHYKLIGFKKYAQEKNLNR